MAATGTAAARQTVHSDNTESREQAVVRRLAEACAQSDWRLVEMGRSLHDDVGQVLTAAGIQFALVADEIGRSNPEFAARLAVIEDLLAESQARIRAVTKDVARSTVERIGLKSSLERIRERWDPAFRGTIGLECPSKLPISAGAMRAIARVADFGLETACNRAECTDVQMSVRTGPLGTKAEVCLTGVKDIFKTVEDEVRWNILKALCCLGGGEAEILLAFQRGDATILKASFPVKAKRQRR